MLSLLEFAKSLIYCRGRLNSHTRPSSLFLSGFSVKFVTEKGGLSL